MKNNIITMITVIALAMLTAACGTLKKGAGSLPTTPDGQSTSSQTSLDPLDAVLATLGDWHTLQTGGNISLKGGSNFSSAIQVRMVRDDAIFISIRPMLGIEVGKLLITADSVYAVDKVHKRYIAEKVSLLTAGIPVTVSDVQDIFLGRPFIIGKGTLNKSLAPQVATSSQGNNTVVSPTEGYKGYNYTFTFDNSKRIVTLNIVPQGSANAAYQVNYGDVRNTKAGNIAHSIKVNASVDKKKLDFTLTYKGIDWNENVNIDRGIPNGYSRMNASSLFSIFSN